MINDVTFEQKILQLCNTKYDINVDDAVESYSYADLMWCSYMDNNKNKEIYNKLSGDEFKTKWFVEFINNQFILEFYSRRIQIDEQRISIILSRRKELIKMLKRYAKMPTV